MVFSPGSTWCRICAIPTARVGAPPARASTVCSPMSRAVASSCSGVIRKPQLLTVCATDATSAPTTAAGLFMAKYTPGSITEAATMAMMATNDSISMPP
ncbi:hypothetical protein D3C76_1687320 [compost metagenome]